jgi:ATP synthase protein I
VWVGFVRYRAIFGLQILSTAAATLLSAWLAGKQGAISAALGGSIGIVATLVFAALASRSGKSKTAGRVLFAALKAEAIRVALMFFSLWFVLKTYQDVVVAGLIGSFLATVIIFAMAVFLVRDA